ncbi:MAG: hypothetical protein GX946_05260 [Oligosphaeraceae bacterium]|nr:hypothetical protein [Oligosphaeraceae bacterium]
MYDFEIRLSDIAVSFQPGHAMRLEVCGQHFPMWRTQCRYKE